ncbi:MAG: alpha/beta hydrolase [Clostridia bacterium]|nr:alpha/beta hydrolase [Clostridia bacterium]
MKVIKDVLYGKYDDRCKLDMYLPDGEGYATIVWFHGGSLTSGSKADGTCLADGFVKAGYAFVSADYRMYKAGAKFPDFIVDAANAVAYIKNNISSYGGDDNKVFVSGQSAGAWLSLMLCLDTQYLSGVGVDGKSIAGWIIDSAQTLSHFNVIKYESGEDSRAQRIDRYAPQFFVSDKTEFSKMLLIFYDNDMPCRYEQNMLFYKSVLYFNKSADITYKVLAGTHCHGSTVKDDDGEYGYVKTSLEWLGKRSV